MILIAGLLIIGAGQAFAAMELNPDIPGDGGGGGQGNANDLNTVSNQCPPHNFDPAQHPDCICPKGARKATHGNVADCTFTKKLCPTERWFYIEDERYSDCACQHGYKVTKKRGSYQKHTKEYYCGPINYCELGETYTRVIGPNHHAPCDCPDQTKYTETGSHTNYDSHGNPRTYHYYVCEPGPYYHPPQPSSNSGSGSAPVQPIITTDKANRVPLDTSRMAVRSQQPTDQPLGTVKPDTGPWHTFVHITGERMGEVISVQTVWYPNDDSSQKPLGTLSTTLRGAHTKTGAEIEIPKGAGGAAGGVVRIMVFLPGEKKPLFAGRFTVVNK